MKKFYNLIYHDRNQSVSVGIIEHTSTAHRDYVYMLSPRPGLDQIVGQDYLTNLYHVAWLLNAFNDRHLEPAKFNIASPLEWWHQHAGNYRNSVITIDDHFLVKPLKLKAEDTIVSLYDNLVSYKKRHLLSNLDVR